MLKKNLLRRLMALAGAVTILASMCTQAAAAEKILDIEYKKITCEGFVADTLNGVEARYNRYRSTIYCVELVERYYQQLYGLKVRTSGKGIQVVGNDQFWFEETTTPKTGDVMFGSAAARGKGYNHWGLVKAYDPTTNIITCFEQNWRWNGQAGVDRQIAFPSCYRYYTLRCKDPALLKALRPLDEASDWAKGYVAKAETTGLVTITGNYQAPVTRESLCRMALKLLENKGHFINWRETCEEAYRRGLIRDAEASCEEEMTREQAAVILSRLLQQMKMLPEKEADLTAYEDEAEISQWAKKAVAQISATGLMGAVDGEFRPQEMMSKEQAVSILIRIQELAVDQLQLNAAN